MIDDFFGREVDRIFEAAEFPKDHPEYDKLYALIKDDMRALYATTSVTMGLSSKRVDLITRQTDTFIAELKGIKNGQWPE